MASPTEADEDWFDPDITALNLGYGEKAGLQIYRNYTRSFQEHAIKRFVETIDRDRLDVTDLQRLLGLVVREDARFLPVIVCAFADNCLKDTFKAVLPDRIPGGKASLFSGYGPLTDLAKRIQLAYAFDVLSRDLMHELDRVRAARNAISHSWDVSTLTDFFTKGRVADIHPIEEMFYEREELTKEFPGAFEPLPAFRIRLTWISGRLVYEAAAYNRAKQARLPPARALYGKPAPKWLTQVSKLCFEATKEIAKQGR